MSTLKVDTIKDTSGVEVYTAKAWVNFNGTGTVAIRAAGNVSSITDNGTGNYTVNFTNAMPDVDYAAVASVDSWAIQTDPSTTSGVLVIPFNTTSGVAIDRTDVQVAVFR